MLPPRSSVQLALSALNVITRVSAVAECSVFGTPDERWGEAVHAAVKLATGVLVNPEELIAFVKAESGSVKAPKAIHFVPDLPKNAAGKVSRADVRALILGQ